jgi:glycosyltransferase involved in cell wall biosynthesis
VLQQALKNKPGIQLTGPEDAQVILFSADQVLESKMDKWKAQDKKFVHRVDGTFGREGRPHREAGMLALNRKSDITVFQSHHNRNTMLVLGYRDGPVIHNGVDLEYINAVPGNPKNKVFTVMTACRSAAAFKQNYLINTLADIPGIQVLFAGRNFGYNDKVKFLGDLDLKNLIAMMKSCDLFFHPAVNDSCPNVVLEAMACGLPVLYSGTGGTVEIIDGFGYKMSGNLRRDIEYIRNNMFAPRVILGWAKQYDINFIADAYIKVFGEL